MSSLGTRFYYVFAQLFCLIGRDIAHSVYQHVFENVTLDQIRSKESLNIIRFLLLVSHLTFLDLGIFGDFFLDVCLKNGFFKSCFQHSAQGKTTVQTGENIMFSVNTYFMIVFAIKISIFKLLPPS